MASFSLQESAGTQDSLVSKLRTPYAKSLDQIKFSFHLLQAFLMPLKLIKFT